MDSIVVGANDDSEQRPQLRAHAEVRVEREEEDGRFRTEQDLRRTLSQFDPDRMKLTEEEYENALGIKEMVESMPDLDNLSDLMYAQFAIVYGASMPDVIERCYGLQAFKEEYKVLDSYEHGCRCIDWALQLFPLHFLSFAFAAQDGTYILIQDMEKFDPKAFTSAGMEEQYIAAMYYINQLLHPDVEAIRKGHIVVAECQGLNLRRDHLKHFTKLFEHFTSNYPFIGQVHCFHTGAMANVMASMLKKILPKDTKDDFQVGFEHDGHLGDLLLVPTVEEANARVSMRMKAALKIRYESERAFKLE